MSKSVENFGRKDERACFRGFCEVEHIEEALRLEAELITLLTDSFGLSRRRYDDWAMAFYEKDDGPVKLRQEPIMITRWTNRIEVDPGELSRATHLSDEMIIGNVVRDGKVKSIIGNPSAPPCEGIRVIIRGRGLVQNAVRDFLYDDGCTEDREVPSGLILSDDDSVFAIGAEVSQGNGGLASVFNPVN